MTAAEARVYFARVFPAATSPESDDADDDVDFGPMPLLTVEDCERLDNDDFLNMFDAYEKATGGDVAVSLRAVTRRIFEGQRRQEVVRFTRARLDALRAHRVRSRSPRRRSGRSFSCQRSRSRSPGRRSRLDDPA